jgi:apolipoprotein D and lipocalin family protein
MHKLIAAFCLVLAGCAPRAGVQTGTYRAAATPIYSNAVFDLARLDGRWDQVATFADSTQNGCRPGGAEFARLDDNLQLTYRLCLSGNDVAGSGELVTTGPGRFAINGADATMPDWWVLWVDEGYRTMAIGNPDGSFGFILNRGRSLPTDRLTAAREVLDFNGYDTDKLVVFKGR